MPCKKNNLHSITTTTETDEATENNQRLQLEKKVKRKRN